MATFSKRADFEDNVAGFSEVDVELGLDWSVLLPVGGGEGELFHYVVRFETHRVEQRRDLLLLPFFADSGSDTELLEALDPRRPCCLSLEVERLWLLEMFHLGGYDS